MRTSFRIMSIFIGTLIVIAFAHAGTIYVDGDNTTGPWDGTQANPYQRIQEGIDKASDSDTVLVADGTYTGDLNKNLDFKGKTVTVTSQNGAKATIIDCEGEGRGFHFYSGETSESVVSGFTITNGKPANGKGGAIYCELYSSPTIEDNVIKGNEASSWGGGICCAIESSPAIRNNEITGNSAYQGGGIYCDFSHPEIFNNEVAYNSAEQRGAGIYVGNSSSPLIRFNDIHSNAGPYSTICNEGSTSIIDANRINNNSAGGVYCGSGIKYNPALIIIQNNEICRNSGSAIASIRSSPTVINNTIAANFGGDYAISTRFYSQVKVINCIIWANSPSPAGGGSEITITYSNIQGGRNEPGNINTDPLFVDAAEGDYRLQDRSPCIGAGTEVPVIPDTDIEGNPRPSPTGSNPDIGAYENPLGEPAPSNPVIPDANLEAAIRDALNKPTGALTEADLVSLTYLSARSRNISDLTGLEYCTNLTGFDLRSNQISDISVLAYLPDLNRFLLSRNQISDIGVLENLTNLTSVEIAYNQISDVSALANLISLTNLQLDHNQISDIATLANLTNLTRLELNSNSASDLSMLANLTNLTDLDLDRNNITDINALANLTNLTWLDLAYNKVSDISVLANLINLTDSEVEYNQISDITPLVNNTGLGEGDSINLKGNPLNDDAYANHIPALEARGVSLIFDPQSDGTPLIGITTAETVSEGESFSVSIDIGNIANLAGFQLDVVFDPAILKAVGIEEGTFLSDGGGTYWLEPDIDNTAGRISGIACARTGEGGVDGSGMLADITFKAVGEGKSYIGLQNIKLSDSSGNLMPHTAVDGSVTVIEFPPWDVNKDGGVDILDLVLIGQHFGEEITTSLDPNPDVNGDGEVDILDFVLVGQHFGDIYSSAAPSRDIWSFDAKYLPVLIRMYDVMGNIPNPDPDFRVVKNLLHKIILNSRVGKTEVLQNYPNPFNPETWIPYGLGEDADVSIKIHSASGQLVRTLFLGHKPAGYYSDKLEAAYWDGTNDSREPVASGVYFYTIQAGEFSATRKMLMLK